MKTSWMVITPEMADEWLKTTNTRNRNMAESRVRQYALDMERGHWKPSHQGIAFYDDGVLADGQTRLAACVKAKKPFESYVTFGLTVESGAGIDNHRARKTDDQIKIAGMSDWIGKTEIAIVTLLRRISGGTISSSLSAHQAVDICEKYEEALKFTTAIMTKNIRFIRTAPVMTAIVCAYPFVDRNRLEKFTLVLQTGVMESLDDVAAVRLRERLITNAGQMSRGGDMQRIELVKLTMRAIKAFDAREQLKKLPIPENLIYSPKL